METTAAKAEKTFLLKQYLAESLDPIHIGTGEFRLGRVDNTIVREPGTNLPKIPGSSIAGVARAYTAMECGKYRWGGDRSCAGKGGKDGDKHCCKADCPVCTAYGFSSKSWSFQGLAQLSDSRILFFPVYTAAGPVWVTCPAALEDAGCEGSASWEGWNQRLSTTQGKNFVLVCGGQLPNPLDLGWLYLPHYEGSNDLGAPGGWKVKDHQGERKLGGIEYLKAILDRLVMVSNERFCNVVEDQLEVRTSVSISPETGAAEEGALFTWEAIPRACFFFFPVTYLKPEYFRVPGGEGDGDGEIQEEPGKAASVEWVQGNVEKGLGLMEYLGVGGANTRGMGRLRVLGLGGGRQ